MDSTTPTASSTTTRHTNDDTNGGSSPLNNTHNSVASSTASTLTPSNSNSLAQTMLAATSTMSKKERKKHNKTFGDSSLSSSPSQKKQQQQHKKENNSKNNIDAFATTVTNIVRGPAFTTSSASSSHQQNQNQNQEQHQQVRSTTSHSGRHSRSNSEIDFIGGSSTVNGSSSFAGGATRRLSPDSMFNHTVSTTGGGGGGGNTSGTASGSNSNLSSPRLGLAGQLLTSHYLTNTSNTGGVAATMPTNNNNPTNAPGNTLQNSNNNTTSKNNSPNSISGIALNRMSSAINSVADKSVQTLIMAIVVAVLIVILILWVANSMWALIEPYSFPLCGACILSVALHEPPEKSKDPSKRFPIARSIVGAKERFRMQFPTLGTYFSPLVAIPEFFFHSLQSAVVKFGIDKWPGIKVMHEHVQNIVFFAMLVAMTARLSTFFFPSLLVGMLFCSAILGGAPIVFAFLCCWFVSEQRFVRMMRLFLTVLIISFISLLYTVAIVDEFNQGGRSTVKMIQDLGIQIPDNAAEVASSYILSANTTQRLLPALKEFRFNGTWDEVYNNTKAFLVNHTTTLSAALEESQPVAKGVGGVLTNVLKLVLTLLIWSFGKVYEGVLFYMTLSMFLNLDRTILYYCLKKVLTVVFGDENKAKVEAEKTEGRMIGELSTLFASLWHLFVFHFLSTLVWYSVFDMPFSVTVSTVGGIIALFPLSLPPMVTQIIIACIVMAVRKQVRIEMLATGICFWVASMSIDLIVVSEKELPRNKSQMKRSKSGTVQHDGSNSSSNNKPSSISIALDRCISAAQSNIAQKEQPFEKASAFLITTSIVLGLTTYGPVGVVTGPILFIVAHALWDAF